MAHYLDHAATTPMRESARAAYLDAAAEGGNPSSLHASGRQARERLEGARERIAAALGAHPTEVVFTSGGTEADNLAIKGLYWARHGLDPRRNRVITTAIEHHAGLDPVRWLAAEQGATAVELPVDHEGRLRLDALREELARDSAGDRGERAIRNPAQTGAGVPRQTGAAGPGQTGAAALVSVMWANNEVGTIQPVAEVVTAAVESGVPVHSDAVQAVPYVDVDFAASGLTTMAVSAHKVGGPVGIGALVVRRGARLTPVAHGGGQERGIRSGTLDAPAAVAFAVAIEETVAARRAEAERLVLLQRRLVDEVRAAVPGAALSGPGPGPDRLPGNVHFVFPGASSEALLYLLDSGGIEASSGSACTAGVVQASHVLLAMGRSEADAGSTMRFSLGRTSTDADVDAVLAVLPDAVVRARRASGRYLPAH